MNQPQKWQILRSHWALDHPWCRVRQDVVALPNGRVVDDYFVHVRKDVALVLPITSQHEVVMVRQYRHGIQDILLELPAGTFDPTQEQPQVAAQRELQEETGYGAETLIPLSVLYDNPVKDTNRIHLFLAQNAKPITDQQLDETEDIEIVLVPLSEVMTHVVQGGIRVAGTVSALFLGLEWFRSHSS
ncbi:MAG: NUDIX hydrolase [Thainema sp.]